jgi:Tfp pilus assembly protein PilF
LLLKNSIWGSFNPSSSFSTLFSILIFTRFFLGHSKELDACRLYTKAIDLFRHFDLNPTVMAATWTAMGFLYVNKKRYFAANTLLTRGQNADPKLPEPWMGQAWCAERMGHLIEAMDLCRHACSLGLAVRRFFRV